MVTYMKKYNIENTHTSVCVCVCELHRRCTSCCFNTHFWTSPFDLEVTFALFQQELTQEQGISMKLVTLEPSEWIKGLTMLLLGNWSHGCQA